MCVVSNDVYNRSSQETAKVNFKVSVMWCARARCGVWWRRLKQI